MHASKNRSTSVAIAVATALAISPVIHAPAQAQSTIQDASVASGMSAAIPIALVGLSTAAAIHTASVVTVTSIALTAQGIVVLGEALVDGSRETVRFVVAAGENFSLGAGTVLRTAAIDGGTLLYHGSRAMVLLPDATGAALMHHEQITW